MKKVVINVCFGGFSLSNIGEQEYLKRKGKEAFFYKQTKYKFREGADEYTRVGSTEEVGMFSHTVTRDLGKTITDFPKEDGLYFSGREIERDDADLIAVIEQLGAKANGSCAELSIVEIPDKVEYEIDEYDGNEHIAEKHRTWR